MSPIATVGKKCACGYFHIPKTIEDFRNLAVRQRTQIKRRRHRLYQYGYLGTLEISSEKRLIEFYEKLPKNVKEAPRDEVPEKPEPEKRQQPFYGKTEYEKWQLLDEDDYEDW